jgi:hypothetical protein
MALSGQKESDMSNTQSTIEIDLSWNGCDAPTHLTWVGGQGPTSVTVELDRMRPLFGQIDEFRSCLSGDGEADGMIFLAQE